VAIAKRKGSSFVAALPDTAKEQYGLKKSEASTGDDVMPNDDPKGTNGTPTEDQKPGGEPVAKGEDDAAVRLQKAEETAAELRTRLEKAEATATEERNIRLNREFLAKAEGLTHLPTSTLPATLLKAEDGAERSSTEVVAGALRELSEKAPGAASVLMPMLEQANTLLAKGEMFAERGSGTSSMPGSANGKIEALAQQIQKSETGKNGQPLTPEQAYARALNTPEGRRLYEETRVIGNGQHHALAGR
jgi:hypothetical protein